jgi:hypothetical protein
MMLATMMTRERHFGLKACLLAGLLRWAETRQNGARKTASFHHQADTASHQRLECSMLTATSLYVMLNLYLRLHALSASS